MGGGGEGRECSPASAPSQGQAAAPCLRHPCPGAPAGLRDGQGVVANPCQTGLTLRSLGRRRNIGVQRSCTAIIVILLSERGKREYRSTSTDCHFRAHFNLWWARYGWPLIHLVSRRDSQFSRPPYFPAGVNLTAEPAIEPPRGGEHGAGVNCLNKKTPFAESRN